METKEFLEGTGKLMKIVPDLYSDIAKPAAKETGIVLATIPKAINAALEPLNIWIAKKEYNVAKIKKLLEIELQNVKPENIVPPEPYVAIPAIQAISYCMDSDELRSMYAKLLANSMNIGTKNKVHPAFVEIIKQMSPLDSIVLDSICNAPNCFPTITLMKKNGDENTKVILYRHITYFDFATIIDISKSIDNLERNKLIEIKENEPCNLSFYDRIRSSKSFKEEKEFFDSLLKKNDELYEVKNTILFTDFGDSFLSVCVF